MAQRSYGSAFTRNIRYVGSAQSPYEINWPRALAAGLVATDALVILQYLVPSWLGIEPVDVAGMVGALLLPGGGPTAFWVGLATQMIACNASVAAYVAVLLTTRRESTWQTGAALGAALWALGPFTALPLLLGRASGALEGLGANPGVLLLGIAPVSVLFMLLAHLAYGVIAGALYRHIRIE